MLSKNKYYNDYCIIDFGKALEENETFDGLSDMLFFTQHRIGESESKAFIGYSIYELNDSRNYQPIYPNTEYIDIAMQNEEGSFLIKNITKFNPMSSLLVAFTHNGTIEENQNQIDETGSDYDQDAQVFCMFYKIKTVEYISVRVARVYIELDVNTTCLNGFFHHGILYTKTPINQYIDEDNTHGYFNFNQSQLALSNLDWDKFGVSRATGQRWLWNEKKVGLSEKRLIMAPNSQNNKHATNPFLTNGDFAKTSNYGVINKENVLNTVKGYDFYTLILNTNESFYDLTDSLVDGSLISNIFNTFIPIIKVDNKYYGVPIEIICPFVTFAKPAFEPNIISGDSRGPLSSLIIPYSPKQINKVMKNANVYNAQLIKGLHPLILENFEVKNSINDLFYNNVDLYTDDGIKEGNFKYKNIVNPQIPFLHFKEKEKAYYQEYDIAWSDRFLFTYEGGSNSNWHSYNKIKAKRGAYFLYNSTKENKSKRTALTIDMFSFLNKHDNINGPDFISIKEVSTISTTIELEKEAIPWVGNDLTESPKVLGNVVFDSFYDFRIDDGQNTSSTILYKNQKLEAMLYFYPYTQYNVWDGSTTPTFYKPQMFSDIFNMDGIGAPKTTTLFTHIANVGVVSVRYEFNNYYNELTNNLLYFNNAELNFDVPNTSNAWIDYQNNKRATLWGGLATSSAEMLGRSAIQSALYSTGKTAFSAAQTALSPISGLLNVAGGIATQALEYSDLQQKPESARTANGNYLLSVNFDVSICNIYMLRLEKITLDYAYEQYSKFGYEYLKPMSIHNFATGVCSGRFYGRVPNGGGCRHFFDYVKADSNRPLTYNFNYKVEDEESSVKIPLYLTYVLSRFAYNLNDGVRIWHIRPTKIIGNKWTYENPICQYFTGEYDNVEEELFKVCNGYKHLYN